VTVASLSVRISSSDEEIGGARAALLARVGRLDAIVDNASINGVWAPIDDLMPNEWDRIVRVNLRGTYLTLAFALSPHPVRLLTARQKAPRSRLLSSWHSNSAVIQSDQRSLSGRDRYRNISLDAYQALQAWGGHVVWPEGGVPLTKGEPGKAADAPHAIHFLLSASARHITGSPIFIDGGQGLLR